MKIYLKPRGTGMTYDLIKDCLENNKDLIVLNEMKLKYVKELFYRNFPSYAHSIFRVMTIDKDTKLNWENIEKCNIDDTTLVFQRALAEELYIDFSKISIIGDTYYQTTEKTGHDVKNDIKMLVNKLIAQQDNIIMEDFNPTFTIKPNTVNIKPLEIKPIYKEKQCQKMQINSDGSVTITSNTKENILVGIEDPTMSDIVFKINEIIECVNKEVL